MNQQGVVTASEMRPNTAIAAVPFARQNRLGIVGNILAGGSDNAGFPNGRRPNDNVVDIALVAVASGLCMANGDTDKLGFGAACKPSAVPLGATAFKLHDGVDPMPPPAPGPTEAVPPEASVSSAGLVKYLNDLAAASADDKEPVDVGSFAPQTPEDTAPEPVG